MSTTMPMPAEIVSTEDVRDVAAYVRAVRGQLSDLGTDEIEELTGGLEADLTDALPDAAADPVQMFGPPATYAAELRSAAGLPPRDVPRGSAGGLPALLLGLRESRDRALDPLLEQPWWPSVREFLVALRPAWWLLRAYVAYQWVDQSLTGANQVLPYSFVTWLTLAVSVVGSVELGRRGWAARGRWQRGLILVGNLFAVVVMVYGAGGLASHDPYYVSRSSVEPPSEGLYNAGYQVVNVFPYDKNGQPLTDVQLFDDRGRPLAPAAVRYTGRDEERVRLIPALTADGGQGLNVFPLREQQIRPGWDPETGERQPRSTALREATRPDPTQPAVVSLPVPSTPWPSASPRPSGKPAPSLAPEPTATG
ncbi:MAG TPA: hypothetical protein VLL08_16555 [Kineosporiaceae bacterium]|nr:hypothetical protein [Kineosporiaceae bacterium]